MHGTSMRTGGAHMPPGTCTGMRTTMVLYTTSRTWSSPTKGLPAEGGTTREFEGCLGRSGRASRVRLVFERHLDDGRVRVSRTEAPTRRARRRTFDVVGCGATLRREHDPIDRIVLLPQALSPAHGAPTDTTRVAPLPRSLRPGWCCQPNARRARRLTGDGAVSDAEDRHHRRRRSRHEGYPSPDAHPPTSTGAFARRSRRSLCRRANDDGLVSTTPGARNTRVLLTIKIFKTGYPYDVDEAR